MLRYLDDIVIPYITKVRANGKPKGMCIFNVASANLCDSAIGKLWQNNFLYITISSELKLLDLIVNQIFQAELKQNFMAIM